MSKKKIKEQYPSSRLPNQILSYCHKLEGGDLREAYGAARAVLSKGAFNLYVYLGFDGDNAYCLWNPQEIMEWCGFKRTAYCDAKKELCDAGFLVLRDGYDATYDFYVYAALDQELGVKSSGKPDSKSEKADDTIRKSGQDNPEKRIAESGKSDRGVRKSGLQIRKSEQLDTNFNPENRTHLFGNPDEGIRKSGLDCPENRASILINTHKEEAPKVASSTNKTNKGKDLDKDLDLKVKKAKQKETPMSTWKEVSKEKEYRVIEKDIVQLLDNGNVFYVKGLGWDL